MIARPTPNFPLSFSKINMFNQCGLKFDVHNVSKIIKFETNKQMDRGTRIHKEIENYIKYGKALSDESYIFKKQVDGIIALTGAKKTELKLSFDKNYAPIDFFDNTKSDYRTAVDLLITNGDKANIIDWKTGRPNDEVELEMLLFALLVFINYPEINKVRTVLVYLDHNIPKTDIRSRDDVPKLIEIYEQNAAPIWNSLITGSFKPTRNGLCNYCKNQSNCPLF